jgi:predicted RND superfamily exporter protein
MDNLKEYLLENNPDIGKIMTYTDFIKRMNQVMNFPVDENTEDFSNYDVGDGDIDSGSFFGSDDSADSGSFFGSDDSADSGSFFASDDSADSGSFFASDDSADSGSFFASDDSADSSSFFGSDDLAGEELVDGTPVTFEPLSLTDDLTWETLIQLARQVVNEKGDGTLTVADLTEELEKAFNVRGKAYYEIPTDLSKYPAGSNEELKNLISQYLLLYSGSLDKFSDDALEPTQVRMLVQLKVYDTATVTKVLDDVNRYASAHFPENITIENSGIAEMIKALTDMVTGSQIKSLLTALIAVFIIVSVAYKSPTAGLFGIIPLFLSILINFGIMGLFGINLDMVTALIASIAIGVGVDYTIHFLSRYKEERLKSDDLDLVTERTILSSGKAIITNAVSVGLGFAVLVFSKFVVLRFIGVLVTVIMGTSSLAALTVLPALLNLFKPKFISKK